MGAATDSRKPPALPIAIAALAQLGSLLAAWVIIRPPYLGDPGPGFIVPEPTVVQYAFAAACLLSPAAAIAVSLLMPSHRWRTITIMLATVFGLVDLLAGVVALILAVLIIQSVLRGRWPNFF